jgi:threonine dehydrogenase-like Zn-dependent dehydrogenase
MDRPGAFAEYVAVPERVLIPWPEDLPAATAVFTEPLANGINAMRQGPNARRSRVVTLGQKCVSGTYSGSMDDLRQSAQLLAAGDFETSWATRYTLEEGETGFRDMMRGEGNKIKAILEF